MLIIIIVITVLYMGYKIHELSQEMSEYRTHGLNMYCDDPSAHYKFIIGKKAKKGN